MAGMVNKVYCMQSLSYVYVLFHVVNEISSYTLSGVANTANIEWSSFKWSITRGQKQRKTREDKGDREGIPHTHPIP